MKKLFFVLLTLLVFVTASFASGGSEGGGGDGTITFAIWDSNQKPGMDAMARDFESKNPGIKVVVEVTPWNEYWQKLQITAASGNMPDVFWMHVNNSLYYASSDILLALDDYDIDFSPFSQNITDMYIYEGKHYGVPKDFDTIAMWYNKKLFDDAGVEYPKAGWTWDDFLEKAKALTNANNDVYGFLPGTGGGQDSWWNFVYQNNGAIIENGRSALAKPETVEAIQWYKDLIYKHKVAPTIDQMGPDIRLQWFLSGKGAMTTFGSWQAKPMKDSEYARENFQIVELPRKKRQATITNGLAYSISKDSKNLEAAIKFVKYLATEEANIIHGESAAAIPLYKGKPQEAWIKGIPEFDLKVFVDGLDYSVAYPNAPGQEVWGPWEEENITKILSDKADLKSTLIEWEKNVNEAIDEAN